VRRWFVRKKVNLYLDITPMRWQMSWRISASEPCCVFCTHVDYKRNDFWYTVPKVQINEAMKT